MRVRFVPIAYGSLPSDCTHTTRVCPPVNFPSGDAGAESADEQAIEARLGKISNHLEVQVAHGGMGVRTYTVKAGDTLSEIAKAEYGDASQWKKIQAANADLIRDPDKIQPGWKLQLP